MFANNIVAMFFLIRTKPKLLLKINFNAMDALKNKIKQNTEKMINDIKENIKETAKGGSQES